jgi:hypothetical protein
VLSISLEVDQPLFEPPDVAVLSGSARRLASLQRSNGNTFTYQYEVDAAFDREGTATIVADVLSAAGVEALDQSVRTVDFDFRAPSLVPGTARLSLSVPAGCPLEAVERLSPQGRAVVEFVLDESSSAQVVFEPRGVLNTRLRNVTSNYFSFEVEAPDAGTGEYQLFADVSDLAGNAQRVALGLILDVDTTVPAAPDVASPAGIVYRRVPWGRRDAGAEFRVSVAPGAVAEAEAVEVLNEISTLGVSRVNDGGALIELPVLDRPVVWVRAVDLACNRSPKVDVKHVEWLATLLGKVPGRIFENPHRLVFRESFAQTVAATPWSTEVDLSRARGSGRPEWSLVGGLPLRYNPALFYDSLRQRVMRFGGIAFDSTTTDELWEWDGERWLNRTPSPRPSDWPLPITSHGMAYDPVSGRAFLFGGVRFGPNGGIFSDELWVWDAASNTWQDLTPTPRPALWPPARGNMGITFDPIRRVLLVFGGSNSNNMATRDLWEWDGSVFRNRTPQPLPASWPANSVGHRMVFDTARRVVVLRGGERDNSMWDLIPDSGVWVNRTPNPLPSSWPTQDGLSVVAYLPERQTVLSFGGFLPGNTGSVDSNLWEWEPRGGAFRTLTPSPLPAVWPGPRAGSGGAYDSSRGRLVVSGGSHDGGELWEWAVDGGTWSMLQSEARPSQRAGASLNFHAPSGSAFLFGGAETDELWELTRTGMWLNRTPSPRPAAWPPPRSFHAAGYDSVRDRIVLFGGANDAGLLSDVWELDPNGATWARKAPMPGAMTPTPRFSTPMVFDKSRGRFLLFGGGVTSVSSFVSSDALWELDSATGRFNSLSPNPRPPMRWPPGLTAPALAYDEQRGRLLVFGGRNSFVASDVLWEWDPGNGEWTNLTPSPRPREWPPATHSHRMEYLPRRGTVLLFGGDAAGMATTQLWEWNPSSKQWGRWSPSPRPTAWPLAGTNAATTIDAESERLLAFGGEAPGSPDGLSNETWEFDLKVGVRPGVVATFVFSASGAESNAKVTSVALATTAIATPSTGTLVYASDAMALKQIGSASGAGPFEWVTTDSARLAALFQGGARELSVAVAPLTSGATRSLPSVELRWVELMVTYDRP